MFDQNDRVHTPQGHGTVVYRRMASPTFSVPEAYSVRLDRKDGLPGYSGTMFSADDVAPPLPECVAMREESMEGPTAAIVARFCRLAGAEARMNERGNLLITARVEGDRYVYDFQTCTPEKGWQQWDTAQDASYFGIWVQRELRLTLSFVEGDLKLCWCSTIESFRAEISSMEGFYGEAPPAATGIGADGTVTHFYDERFSATEV